MPLITLQFITVNITPSVIGYSLWDYSAIDYSAIDYSEIDYSAIDYSAIAYSAWIFHGQCNCLQCMDISWKYLQGWKIEMELAVQSDLGFVSKL